MWPHIIDGERWIVERLKFLRARLDEDLPQDERLAIEAEIDVLSHEHGLTVGGRRLFRLPRSRAKGNRPQAS